MKRVVIFGLVAFGVAAIVAFLMSFLPFQGETKFIMPVVVGILVAFSVTAMAGNRKVVTVGVEDRSQALSAAPPDGTGAVWIYREGFVGKAIGYDVVVDGQTVAQLKSPASTRLVLSAGSHTITAALPGPASGMSPNPAQLTLDVTVGQTLVYRMNMKMGALKNTLILEPQADVATALRKLSGTPMIAAVAATA